MAAATSWGVWRGRCGRRRRAGAGSAAARSRSKTRTRSASSFFSVACAQLASPRAARKALSSRTDHCAGSSCGIPITGNQLHASVAWRHPSMMRSGSTHRCQFLWLCDLSSSGG